MFISLKNAWGGEETSVEPIYQMHSGIKGQWTLMIEKGYQYLYPKS
jgi:hypothetical protein